MNAEDIKNSISDHLKEAGESVDQSFNYGEFVNVPNNKGVFLIKERWFIYEIDEKNERSITGPFQNEDIIYACAMLMHISKYFDEYRFSPQAKDIYIHTHFRSIKEAEENLEGGDRE